jgi:hypothetical protein
MQEIDLTDRIAQPEKLSRKDFVINHHPSQSDIDLIEQEEKILISVVLTNIMNDTYESIRDRFLKECNIKPSNYHILYTFFNQGISPDIIAEKAIENLIDSCEIDYNIWPSNGELKTIYN